MDKQAIVVTQDYEAADDTLRLLMLPDITSTMRQAIATIFMHHRVAATEASEEQYERVIAGLNAQLTEQFDLTTKQAARLLASEERATLAEREVERLKEALTPSGETKAVYMGEFSFSLTRVDEAGDEYQEKVYVPWDTIKEIMAAIRNQPTGDDKGG